MRTSRIGERLRKWGRLALLSIGLWTVLLMQGVVYGAVLPRAQAAPPVQPADDKALAIAKVAAAAEIAPVLANHPNWVAEAYPDDEAARIWHVDFYAEPEGEYLGYGHVNLKSNELFEIEMPRDLSPAALQAGIAKIEAYLPYDAEVQARLGNPTLWYHDISYDRWEQVWQVYYSRGLTELLMTFYIDENAHVTLDAIVDPALLSAEKAAEERRNRALNLAYSAEGVDEALAGVDNWQSYVEDQGRGQYTVAFTTAGRTLYRVQVDIDQEAIMAAGP